MTTSRDCVSTEQKIAFMQKAMEPGVELFISSIGSDREYQLLNPNKAAWNFEDFVYELRPRKLTDAEKIERALGLLDFPSTRTHPIVMSAIAILKGESHD